jgi:Na+/proline symporter
MNMRTMLIIRGITCLAIIVLALSIILRNPSSPDRLYAYGLMLVAVLAFVLPIVIQKFIRRMMQKRGNNRK